jgi:hypothetical protein
MQHAIPAMDFVLVVRPHQTFRLADYQKLLGELIGKAAKRQEEKS